MLILTIETSSEKGLLALSQKDELIRSIPLDGGRELSKTLSSQVKTLLEGAIPDLIAVGVGPGSYTGIRVAIALAKALAYGWQKPLMGFCSLKAFCKTPIILDARSGGFYALLTQKPERISPSDGRLHNLPLIYSPHPELIEKRLHNPIPLKLTSLDPKALVKQLYTQYKEEGIKPFEPEYLSHP